MHLIKFINIYSFAQTHTHTHKHTSISKLKEKYEIRIIRKFKTKFSVLNKRGRK